MAYYSYRLTLLLLLALGVADARIQKKKLTHPGQEKYSSPISLQDLAQTNHYTHIGDGYQAPLTIDPVLHKAFFDKGYADQELINYPEQYVITLPNAQLLSNQGMVITADNRPFSDYAHQTGRKQDWKFNWMQHAFDLRYPDTVQKIDESIAVIATPGGHCYYHWMLDILPRLKILQLSGIPYDKVFVGDGNQKFVQETLKALGLSDNQILYGKKTTHIQATNVLIPSMPNLVHFSRPTWACDFIRAAFLEGSDNATTPARTKLYVSRQSFSDRKSQRTITNEDQLITFLEAKGFEAVTLENLSVKEQAQLFNSAEIIVAAHGAALTNLIFCNSKLPVTVIEIYQPHYINECYISLTQQLNSERNFHFKHSCLMTSAEKLSTKDRYARNIHVELDALKTHLTNHVIP